MTPQNALQVFHDYLDTQSLTLETITLADGLAAALSLYRAQRFDDCDLDADGDMLLFQWGREAPDGEWFAVDIARQLMFGNTDDDIWQLSLRFGYALTGEPIPDGNRWCGDLTPCRTLKRLCRRLPWCVYAPTKRPYPCNSPTSAPGNDLLVCFVALAVRMIDR